MNPTVTAISKYPDCCCQVLYICMMMLLTEGICCRFMLASVGFSGLFSRLLAGHIGLEIQL